MEKGVMELLRKWKLEYAELEILKLLCCGGHKYDKADEYRAKQMELDKRFGEVVVECGLLEK